MVIREMSHYFGGHVEGCSAVCLGSLIKDLSEAKITNFTNKASTFFSGEKDIITFDIAMDDILLVDGLYPAKNLLEYSYSFSKPKDFGIDFGLISMKCVHITELHNEKIPTTIYIISSQHTRECAIKSHHIWMVEGRHCLGFLLEILLKFGILCCFFQIYAFDCVEGGSVDEFGSE